MRDTTVFLLVKLAVEQKLVEIYSELNEAMACPQSTESSQILDKISAEIVLVVERKQQELRDIKN